MTLLEELTELYAARAELMAEYREAVRLSHVTNFSVSTPDGSQSEGRSSVYVKALVTRKAV